MGKQDHRLALFWVFSTLSFVLSVMRFYMSLYLMEDIAFIVFFEHGLFTVSSLLLFIFGLKYDDINKRLFIIPIGLVIFAHGLTTLFFSEFGLNTNSLISISAVIVVLLFGIIDLLINHNVLSLITMILLALMAFMVPVFDLVILPVSMFSPWSTMVILIALAFLFFAASDDHDSINMNHDHHVDME